ncbi:hypothetical protein LJK88_30845 [Paenibacillus sp. P26]|nr:hypothetical protein LJK88_30845 [Paenibacillus sp. P26]
MDEPLGPSIGNALEVAEAIETLQGRGPKELTELCLELAAHMIRLGGQAGSEEEAKRKASELLYGGAGLAKLKQFIAAQGETLLSWMNRTGFLPRAIRSRCHPRLMVM